MKQDDFNELMQRLAEAWSAHDTEAALACFAFDAIYMEPPDIQLYQGHEQLRPYFGALAEGTIMVFHNLWFDEQSQVGAGEYSFGLKGSENADHGVVVVEIREGRIAIWREYQQKGPADFRGFLSTEGKSWRWHIGNYP
jgi:ketosteroid isomerase-like protein